MYVGERGQEPGPGWILMVQLPHQWVSITMPTAQPLLGTSNQGDLGVQNMEGCH